MKFAKLVFLIAGIYGLIVVLPQYFMEAKNGRDFPPPINHPEFYFGFVGVTLAWQVLFLVLSTSPVRYLPVMIPAILEKLSFSIAVPILFLQNRVGSLMLALAMIDLILGLLFIVAYLKTPREQRLVQNSS